VFGLPNGVAVQEARNGPRHTHDRGNSMRILILGAATIALAGCGGGGLENVAREQCIEQGAQVEGQLAAAGLDLEEYCACATEGLTAADATNQEELAGRAQQCISDAMSNASAG